MTLKRIESLLIERIGLSPEAIGGETVTKAISDRMRFCGDDLPSAYLDRLSRSEAEWNALVERVVVPETWFFRNKASFAFLGHRIRTDWLGASTNRKLRALSIPCAGGEEPYSIAMALLDTGLAAERFTIDAVDISNAALEKASAGIYGKESFRGSEVSFRNRYFTESGAKFRVIPEIRNRVRILKGNILDDRLLADADPYHVIFCRNLLIYLTPEAQRIAVENLDRLLAINGLLFVGHVERKPAGIVDYDWIRKPGVFACRKTHRKEKASQTPPSPAKPVSGQKITLRPPVPLNAAVVSQSVQNDPPQSAPATQPAPAQTTPGDPLERAQQMADRGRMEDALKICQQCVSENAFHSPAHFLMGLIHHAMDEEERAEGCFNKAVYLDPNHEEALTYLAFIAEHRGDRDKAVHLRQWAQRIRDRKGKTA